MRVSGHGNKSNRVTTENPSYIGEKRVYIYFHFFLYRNNKNSCYYVTIAEKARKFNVFAVTKE